MSEEKTVHSKIGASSYYRWKACAASVRLSEGIESVSSPYAQEGTAAHGIAAAILLGQPWSCDNPEMLEAIHVYTAEIERLKSAINKPKIMVEHSFNLSELHDGLYGTGDCLIYDPEAKGLYVIDYKHGAGIPVEVEGNLQLRYYGLGALMTCGVAVDWVELIVVQPRCHHKNGPVRRERIDVMEMLEFSSQLKADALATEDLSATPVPGDHCRFCPALKQCPAVEKKANEIAKKDFAVPTPGATFSAEKLSETMSWFPVLRDYMKVVEEFAENHVMRGGSLPGYKLVAGRGSRKWKDEKEAKEYLEMVVGLQVQDMFDTSFKSVAQMEKVISKKELESLIETRPGAPSLVPESDKRPALLLDAKSDFSVI